VRIITVPYHIDDYTPDLDLPLRAGETVKVELSSGVIWERLVSIGTAVAGAVTNAAVHNGLPVVVSGDCTTALGTVAGLQHAGTSAGIVWFDAHGDVQTLETTTSGYLGGLPLRLLAGYRPELLATRLGLAVVPEERIVLVGARDLDPPEVSYLAGAKIRRAEVAGLTPEVLPDGPLYIHIDLDVIDPLEVPGLRYPAPGGPGADQLAGALQMLAATGQVAAIGLACTWHPGHPAPGGLHPVLETILSFPG
jgi:arginase